MWKSLSVLIKIYLPALKSEVIFENPVNRDVAYASAIFHGIVCPILWVDRVLSLVLSLRYVLRFWLAWPFQLRFLFSNSFKNVKQNF